MLTFGQVGNYHYCKFSYQQEVMKSSPLKADALHELSILFICAVPLHIRREVNGFMCGCVHEDTVADIQCHLN